MSEEDRPNVGPMPFSVFEKAERFYGLVQQRLQRAVSALEAARIPYAVIGGNAVMSWVARADASAVRPTQDVDLLLSPSDFEAAKRAPDSFIAMSLLWTCSSMDRTATRAKRSA
jgi:hypothetical protein